MSNSQTPFLSSTSKKTPDILARVISDLANPFFFPPLIFIFMGWKLFTSREMLFLTGGIVLLSYTVIPLTIALRLLRNGHLSSLDAPDQKSRTRLYGLSTISSASGSLILYVILKSTYPFLAAVALVYVINLFVGLLINLRWKISIHTASISVAVTLLLFFFLTKISPVDVNTGILTLGMLLLLLPLMVWARYHLKVHSISELMGGIIMGSILTVSELVIIL